MPRSTYFTVTHNGEARIVLNGWQPHDPRTASAEVLREFADKAARASLIRFAVWNDRNGCFTDAQMRREFGRVATTAELRETVRSMIENF